jgi:leucyl-tRNA synthetase
MIIDDRAEDVSLDESVHDIAPTHEQLRLLHRTIRAVTEDIERLAFNTAISRMMEFTNEMTELTVRPKSVLESFVLLLAPFAPHLAEELWAALGHQQTLAYEPWPVSDPAYLVQDTVEVPVQICGKLRGRIVVPAGLSAAELQAFAEADQNVQTYIEGKVVLKVIAVPGRMVNFVVR